MVMMLTSMMQIHNAGTAAVVVVSCVTKDPPYYPHPHSLVGSSCKDGVCTLRVKGGADTIRSACRAMLSTLKATKSLNTEPGIKVEK